MNISDKILAISAELGPKKKDLDAQRKRLEDLTAQIAEIDDNDQEELLLAEVEEVGKGVDTLTGEVEGMEKKLDSYRAIEKRQAVGSRPAQQDAPAMIRPEAKQSKPGDLIVRSAVVAALSHLRRCPEQQLIEELYPDDLRFKAAMPMLMKTAAPIATTTDANYAAALVQEDIRGIMETIESQSVAAAMALWASRSGGMLVNFGSACQHPCSGAVPDWCVPDRTGLGTGRRCDSGWLAVHRLDHHQPLQAGGNPGHHDGAERSFHGGYRSLVPPRHRARIRPRPGQRLPERNGFDRRCSPGWHPQRYHRCRW